MLCRIAILSSFFICLLIPSGKWICWLQNNTHFVILQNNISFWIFKQIHVLMATNWLSLCHILKCKIRLKRHVFLKTVSFFFFPPHIQQQTTGNVGHVVRRRTVACNVRNLWRLTQHQKLYVVSHCASQVTVCEWCVEAKSSQRIRSWNFIAVSDFCDKRFLLIKVSFVNADLYHSHSL